MSIEHEKIKFEHPFVDDEIVARHPAEYIPSMADGWDKVPRASIIPEAVSSTRLYRQIPPGHVALKSLNL